MTSPTHGWNDSSYGGGIRRMHRVKCPSTAARRQVGKCSCGFGFTITWPDPSKGPKGRKQRPYSGFATEREAREEKQRLEVQARDARRNPGQFASEQREAAGVPTVFEWLIEWQRRTELKPDTQWTVQSRDDAYRKRVHERWGHVPVDQVRREDVMSWIWEMYESEVGPNDENYRAVEFAWKTLSELLSDACRWGHCSHNPASRRLIVYPPRRVQKKPKRQKAYTREQIHHLLDVCEQPVAGHMARSPAASLAVVGLGMELLTRRGEVAGLRVRHLNLVDCFVDIEDNEVRTRRYRGVHLPKDREERRPSISAGLRDVLVAHLAEVYGDAPPPDGPVFPFGRLHGGVMSPNAVGHWLHRLGRRARLVDIYSGEELPVTLTRLRATGMTLADVEGVARRTTANQAGHGTEAVTSRHYIDHSVDDKSLKEFSAVYEGLWAERERRPAPPTSS